MLRELFYKRRLEQKGTRNVYNQNIFRRYGNLKKLSDRPESAHMKKKIAVYAIARTLNHRLSHFHTIEAIGIADLFL